MMHSPDPQRETPTLDDSLVWQEITRVARAALRDAPTGADAAIPVNSRMRATSSTGESWDVRAQSLLHAANGLPVVVVALERVGGAPAFGLGQPVGAPDPGERHLAGLRERFGLSRRQGQVALLLARRLTDKEIAANLGISRHTARRHVEIVLIRLRVHSRAEVGEVLDGGNGNGRLAAGNES